MNTNFQTFHQMGSAISDFVKQATGRDNVQNIDMDHVTVAQNHVYDEVDASGRVVQFSAGAEGIPFEKCVVKIEPVQDLHGYDHPWPAGGGKNLCYADASNLFPRGDGLTIVENAETYTAYAKVKKNTDYVFSCATTPIRSILFGFESEPTVGVTAHSLTYTSPTTTSRAFNSGNYEWIGIYYGTPKNPQMNVMIETGTSPTSYAPYSNICPITGWTMVNVYQAGQNLENARVFRFTFPSEAGVVYGGTLDVVSGELVVDRAEVDLGTLNWIYSYSNGRSLFTSRDLANRYKPSSASNIPVNAMFECYLNVAMASTFMNGEAGLDGGISSRIVVCDNRYTDAVTFKAAMSGVQLVYELATPITYQLTPTEIRTLLGLNNIWADTGDIEVKFTNLKELY